MSNYFSGTSAKARPTAATTSVANLRTFGPSSMFFDGMLARILGVNSYEYSTSSAAADNGTTVIKPADAGATGRWVAFGGAGAQGAQGLQGLQGVQGTQGAQGAQGGAGTQGAQGLQGLQGFQGANELPIVPATTLTFNTSNGTADVTAYTVPASPSGSNRFGTTFVLIRLETAITGGGNVVVRAGTTTGGNELLVDSVAWNSSTPVGTTVGFLISELGAAFLNATVAPLAASATVKARATTAGGGISGGSAKVSVYGFVQL